MLIPTRLADEASKRFKCHVKTYGWDTLFCGLYLIRDSIRTRCVAFENEALAQMYIECERKKGRLNDVKPFVLPESGYAVVPCETLVFGLEVGENDGV